MKYDKPNKTAHSLTWLMCVIHSYKKQDFNTDVGCDTTSNGNVWDTGRMWMNNQHKTGLWNLLHWVMTESGRIIVFTLH
jgi:hypothetical protein